MSERDTVKQDLLNSVNAFIKDAHLDPDLGHRLRLFFRYQANTSSHLSAMQASRPKPSQTVSSRPVLTR